MTQKSNQKRDVSHTKETNLNTCQCLKDGPFEDEEKWKPMLYSDKTFDTITWDSLTEFIGNDVVVFRKESG